jgi:8-oxo-dGTP diphosphatase
MMFWMNDVSPIPIFGEKLADQTYLERPGAYAVIRDIYQRIATLRVGTAFFLPGGGSAPDETPPETLHREIAEECGRAIQIGPELGIAIEYIYAKSEGVYYQIRSTFFEAMFIEGQVEQIEKDHMLVWLSASEAIQHFQRQSQAWAVQQLVRRADGFLGTSWEN